MDVDKMLAVVERKTLDNLLAEFGMMPVPHQRLTELAALVYTLVEAQSASPGQ